MNSYDKKYEEYLDNIKSVEDRIKYGVFVTFIQKQVSGLYPESERKTNSLQRLKKSQEALVRDCDEYDSLVTELYQYYDENKNNFDVYTTKISKSSAAQQVEYYYSYWISDKMIR